MRLSRERGISYKLFVRLIGNLIANLNVVHSIRFCNVRINIVTLTLNKIEDLFALQQLFVEE